MPSAVIRRYAHRPELPALDIEFVTGRVYRYHGVPAELVEEMWRRTSRGAFFNRRIRNHFRCERLRGGWPDDEEPALA